jgi:hypothetical protein
MELHSDPALPRIVAASSGAAHFGAELSLRQAVRLALFQAQPPRRGRERRMETRHPFPHPVYLTPVDTRTLEPCGPTIVAVGKHLSDHGLDFFYQTVVPHRRVIASLPRRDGGWLGLLMDLTWCRFTGHGWYENGGRFLKVVPSPLAEPSGHVAVAPPPRVPQPTPRVETIRLAGAAHIQQQSLRVG